MADGGNGVPARFVNPAPATPADPRDATIAALRKAVRWYANPDAWQPALAGQRWVDLDRGSIARLALAETGGDDDDA